MKSWKSLTELWQLQADTFPNCCLSNLISGRLDHFPILLKLSQHYQTRKAKRFHFENSWLEEEELSHVVNEALTISTSQAIISKLHTCVDKLDNWGRQIHFCFIWDIDSNSAGTKWLQTLHFS